MLRLLRLPDKLETNITTASADSFLVGARCGLGSRELARSLVGDHTVAVRAESACAVSRCTADLVVADLALALGGSQLTVAAREGCAGAGSVPLSVGDQATVGVSARVNDVDVALAGERSSAATSGAGPGRSCGGSSSTRAAALGQVLDAGAGAAALGAVRGGCNELTGLSGSSSVECVPGLVESAVVALDDDILAVSLLQSGVDITGRVGLRRGWVDASIGEELVGVEPLEEADSNVGKVDIFLCRLVIGVALGVEAGNAGSVLLPFVLPEGFIRTAGRAVLPVGVHVVQKIIGTKTLEDSGDVGVSTVGIAVGLVSTVAVIGPDKNFSAVLHVPIAEFHCKYPSICIIDLPETVNCP